MTKILFWNIEQFTSDKINNAGVDPEPGAGGLTKAQAAAARLSLIYQVLSVTNPDIFVIIEVHGTKNSSSSTAGNNGGLSGAVYLLSQLRDVQHGTAPQNVKSADWRMVPPLWLNKETIAVLYRGTTGGVTRYFTGPNVWSGGAKGRTRISGDVPAVAYGTVNNPNNPSIDFNEMLVPTGTQPRLIPANALYNGTGAFYENTVAGRIAFKDGVTRVDFGDAVTAPFMVTFSEFGGAVSPRNITMFAVHLPANVAGQNTFIDNLVKTDDIKSPLGASETRLVGGDFNMALLNENGTQTNRYAKLTQLNYGLLLVPEGQPPPNVDAYRGYFATHLVAGYPANMQQKQLESKLLWSETDQELAYYPGYGYIGNIKSTSSLDNILVRPKLLPEDYDYQTTIMNFVAGTPFNGVNNPDGNPPIGSLAIQLPTAIGNPPQGWIPWPTVDTAPVYEQGAANALFNWENYSKIYSTSDHFALYAEI
jgi:hypothetical protein